MTTMQGRVSEGAKWLDRHAPGWLDKIDLGRLDVSHCRRCLLGQTFGEYGVIAFHDDTALPWTGTGHKSLPWACAHGFALSCYAGDYQSYSDEARAAAYKVLLDVWATEILTRRFATQDRPVAALVEA